MRTLLRWAGDDPNREGLPIAGATGASYALTGLDVQKLISVRISVSKAQYDTLTPALESNPVDYSVWRSSSSRPW